MLFWEIFRCIVQNLMNSSKVVKCGIHVIEIRFSTNLRLILDTPIINTLKSDNLFISCPKNTC